MITTNDENDRLMLPRSALSVMIFYHGDVRA